MGNFWTRFFSRKKRLLELKLLFTELNKDLLEKMYEDTKQERLSQAEVFLATSGHTINELMHYMQDYYELVDVEASGTRTDFFYAYRHDIANLVEPEFRDFSQYVKFVEEQFAMTISNILKETISEASLAPSKETKYQQKWLFSPPDDDQTIH